MKNIIKKPIFIISAAIFISIVIGGYFYFTRESAPAYEFVLAKRGDIVQEVSITGKVKPAEDVDLAFERSGTISRINVKVGDKISAGKELVSLDNSEISAQLAQTRASVESAKAGLSQYEAALKKEEVKLDELKSGTRPEELLIAETRVLSARKSLADAQINLDNVKNKATIDLANLYDDVKDILNDSYYKADDAANKQTDEMFTDDQSSSPKLSFLTSESQAKSDAEFGRLKSTAELKNIKLNIDNLPAEQSKLDVTLTETSASLSTIRDFLTRLADAVNGAILSQTTITSYKGYVNTGRTNVNTAISNITAQEQLISAQKSTNQSNISTAETKVNEAQSSLTLMENELALKRAGSTSQQIAAQEAQVNQAEANIESAKAKIKEVEANVLNLEAQLAKTVLRSPIDGVVSKQDAKIGQSATVNSPLVSVISEKQFEVEANIPEADIAKVKIGNFAKITLDAYSNDVIFDAKVISIDLAGKILEGVATYKTTLQFMEEDGLLKPELTANIDILTAETANAINIPQRAIFTENEDKFVKILEADGITVREAKVQTGIRGINGEIEILSGVNEGEKVIISISE